MLCYGASWNVKLSYVFTRHSDELLEMVDYDLLAPNECLLQIFFEEQSLSLIAVNTVLILADIHSFARFSEDEQTYDWYHPILRRPPTRDVLAAEVCKLLVVSGRRPTSSEFVAFRSNGSTDCTAGSPMREELITWLVSTMSSSVSLMQLCRVVIRRRLTAARRDVLDVVQNGELKLPSVLKNYLMFRGPRAEAYVENIVNLLISCTTCRRA